MAASLILIINPVTQLQKARDSKIKSNISQIQSALELFRSDCGAYPTPSGNLVPFPLTSSSCPGYTGPAITYLSTALTFPANALIRYSNPGSTQFYRIVACLERNDTSEGTIASPEAAGDPDCTTSHNRAYRVTSP